MAATPRAGHRTAEQAGVLGRNGEIKCMAATGILADRPVNDSRQIIQIQCSVHFAPRKRLRLTFLPQL